MNRPKQPRPDSRSLAPIVSVGLVRAGLHYGRGGGLGTPARGGSHAGAGTGPTPAGRTSFQTFRMAFSPSRGTRGGEVVVAARTRENAREIAGRVIDVRFHISRQSSDTLKRPVKRRTFQ